MRDDVTKLGSDELTVSLAEQRALLGESVANDYGEAYCIHARDRIEELEAEVARRRL
ncbi:hypothetical protein [Rhodococcus tibetensis]|uniref:Uncharacterized protein n=1 Tax=Rhodococcus tibetensis TaxID=2965064 RepID=A0ABT1QKA2_9NOCA|nr:hypothetical protein [Rhodococcus sp. FXJ9.536]MCQ4122721.1 hypothetical protein [Rhodococcus sp. FXJ9.536]